MTARAKAKGDTVPPVTTMKLTMERATLLSLLGQVDQVVERRSTVPILSNVLLDAEGEMLKLVSTDLDIQIVLVGAAAIDTKGATTVAAGLLFDIVRKMPEGAQITLAVTDGRMVVTGGRARFTLPTLPRDDFPMIAVGELPTQFYLPARTLITMIDSTRFAISTEETRYYLNGIHFHQVDDADPPLLKAVATDGHRLAVYSIDRPDGAESLPPVIVSRKAVKIVRKLLDAVQSDAEALIEMAVSPTKIRFHLGDAELTAKLIDGQFPDYGRVIPTTNDKLLRIERSGLIQCIDRVSVIASDSTRAVKVGLERDKVTVAVSSPENGSAVEELAGDYAAAPVEAGFNSRFLLDALGAVEGDDVEMLFLDSAAPMLLRQHEGAPGLFVVMPMRI